MQFAWYSFARQIKFSNIYELLYLKSGFGLILTKTDKILLRLEIIFVLLDTVQGKSKIFRVTLFGSRGVGFYYQATNTIQYKINKQFLKIIFRRYRPHMNIQREKLYPYITIHSQRKPFDKTHWSRWNLYDYDGFDR